MIRLSFNNSDERLVQNLREKGPRILAAAKTKMDGLMISLQAKIVGEKLSGQVLNRRTGKLSNSIRALPSDIESNFQGESIVGHVEGGGGPAFYGRVQEFGGDHAYDIVPINAKALHFFIGGKEMFLKKVHHPPLKERSFMRSSLEEYRETIFDSLRQSVREEMAK